MARYDHLPLYKITYDLLIQILETTKQFSKDYKYTLGQAMQMSTINLLKSIYRANSAKDKAEKIKIILDDIQEVGVLIRISKDIKIISENKFLDLIDKRDSIERQATGWLKSVS